MERRFRKQEEIRWRLNNDLEQMAADRLVAQGTNESIANMFVLSKVVLGGQSKYPGATIARNAIGLMFPNKIK